MKHFFSSLLVLVAVNFAAAQDEFVHTKAFDEKLKHYQLEYFTPAEMFLHPVPAQDDYADYDLVLHADNQQLEVRYIFMDATSKIGTSAMPHLEFYRSIIDFASNDEASNQISIQDMHPEDVKKTYNADWCLVADFIPKEFLTLKTKGRILGIFKEETGLIFCVIFYDDELPEYFDLPVKFTADEEN